MDQGMIESKVYNTPENIFRGQCIYDYIYFIKSFFFYYMKGIYYKQINDDLFKYFNEGNINVFNLNNTNSKTRNKLKHLFASNSNKLLQGNNPFSGGAPKKPPALILLSNNNNSNSSLGKTSRNSANSSSSKRNQPNSDLDLRFLSLHTTPPFSTQKLFENPNLNLPNQYFKNLFNKKNFKNISSAGKQSNMMVSPDNNFYFKQYSSKQPVQTKRNLENECKVYAYLKEKNLNFIENCTCFVNCYTNGILLRNGGKSLELMLKENTFTLRKEYFKLFFYKLHELHKLLVTHNDLHVGNVVGYDYVFFIDFGLATIHPPQVFNADFLQTIHDAFSGLFFALCIKYNIH